MRPTSNTMQNDHSKNEFNDAPLLRSIPKQNPFVVPNGFFEQFPHQVQSHIVAAKAQGSAPAWSRLLSKPALIGSISMILMALLSWWIWKPTDQAPEIAQQKIAQEAEILVVEDLDDQDLSALFANSDNTMADVDLSMDDEVLIDYLENENLSLYFLTEEL
ncbi:MAG: hypothetical protein IPI00_03445 [Flavobacteriales bacterium]|nr:hypothetical protein [Flavobacteriales bacterium]MBK7239235.1 hypothetical protein [Flavobacteriales bacterium]MBK7297487.1 hypothetical protein [Flavobacteriales bacterium]MBK9535561.1 hypothetical protein [Flavobacteriales bacterium]MBP9138909.1 hypothetical protein [Flavobacteriales bacterium]